MSVNEDLAEELYRPVIKKFQNRKPYARPKYNICHRSFYQVYFDQNFNKNNKTVFKGFIVKSSKRQPNNLWVHQGRKFYNTPNGKLRG